VSHELTRRVVAGNFKQVSLQQVVTDSQFQMTHMTRSRVYPSKELALLLLQYTEKSIAPEPIVDRAIIQEIENEPF